MKFDEPWHIMSTEDSEGNRESIRYYFLRSQSEEPPARKFFSPRTDSTECGQGQAVMGEKVTNSELHKLLKSIDMRMAEGFKTQDEKVSSLIEKFEGLEVDVAEIKKEQTKNRDDINRLENEVADMRRSLLHTQTYSRKYHLLVYGVEGYETDPKETIKVVRKFAEESLKLGEQFAQGMTIRNAHRLRRQGGRPTAIIVVFLLWSEREAFLRAATNLKGSGMSVRTDLPPVLKQLRGKLASDAYQMRQEQGIQTRIRERGADIWIETRPNSSSSWKRFDSK